MECCKLETINPALPIIIPVWNRGHSWTKLTLFCKVESLSFILFSPPLPSPKAKIPDSAGCDQGILPLYKQNGELLNALMADIPRPTKYILAVRWIKCLPLNKPTKM